MESLREIPTGTSLGHWGLFSEEVWDISHGIPERALKRENCDKSLHMTLRVTVWLPVNPGPSHLFHEALTRAKLRLAPCAAFPELREKDFLTKFPNKVHHWLVGRLVLDKVSL